MKKYEKPVIFKNEFVADEAVAACGDVSVTDKATEVDCIISGSATVFLESCGTKGTIVSYGGKTYVTWYNGKNDRTAPTTDQETLLHNLGISGSGYHASDISSIVTTTTAS